MSAQVVQTGFAPSRFRPAWWLRNRHAQTLAGKYLRSSRGLPLERRKVDTPDGDVLDLDFAPEPALGTPLVVLLHGLEGSTQREYMSLMFRELFDSGLRGVGLNFRGCGGEPNRLPRAYHSGDTGDLAHVIARLRHSRPGRAIGAVGFSLGDGSSKV
ncbi:MAG: alpha/beta fold hydrolase [Gemmatimonadota bacterium]|nr:alpha/beta fold hydrolase [Gemmatimonadota bacterium]